uniref:hypothetical protein n=1 Tax=Prevotella sp. TaxID=59823 RepID=UPI0040261188
MKKAILFFLVLLPFRVFAQGDLLQSLDSVLNRRRYYIDIKENRIRRLTQEVKGVTTGIVLPLQESSFGNITPTVSQARHPSRDFRRRCEETQVIVFPKVIFMEPEHYKPR